MKLTEREKWLMAEAEVYGCQNYDIYLNDYDNWLSENEQRLASEAPDNWIPVSERLPDDKQKIWAYSHGTGVVPTAGDTNFDFADSGFDYWMPRYMPKPPTGED